MIALEVPEFSPLNGSAASESNRRAIAEMIISSLPGFYNLLAEQGADIIAVVAERLVDGAGELDNCHVLWATADMPAGVFCAYPSDNLARAQMMELRALMRGWDKKRKHAVQDILMARVGAVAPVPDGGCYLSRFAVGDAQRGTGLADRLMAGFLEFAAGRGPIFLHVDKGNGRAIRFYERHGFRLIADGDAYLFRTMERSAGG